jgi:hypothetical protein
MVSKIKIVNSIPTFSHKPRVSLHWHLICTHRYCRHWRIWGWHPSRTWRNPNPSQLCSSRDSEPNDIDLVDDRINTNRNALTIKIKILKKVLEEWSTDIHSIIFCPTHLCETVIALIEYHFCAHPLILGYLHPSAVGICQWAVKQMYTFCKENNLCELWAYLWENRYWRGRWEL